MEYQIVPAIRPWDQAIISSGSFFLDLLFGGGLPRGKCAMVSGEPDCGKTTAALAFCASVLAHGGSALYVDADHTFNAAFARNIGVDLARLELMEPASGKEAFALAASRMASHLDLLVIDSAAALALEDGATGDFADEDASLRFQWMLSDGLRQLFSCAALGPCAILFTNQMRTAKTVNGNFVEIPVAHEALKPYLAREVALLPSRPRVEDGRIGAWATELRARYQDRVLTTLLDHAAGWKEEPLIERLALRHDIALPSGRGLLARETFMSRLLCALDWEGWPFF